MQGLFCLARLGTLSVHLSIDIVTIRTIVTGVQGREPFTLLVGGCSTTNLEGRSYYVQMYEQCE